jgi:hypothetical protein
MAASLLLILIPTVKICVKHGTHINLYNTYSSRSRIALITQKQGGVTISEAHKLQTAYANTFATGIFHSACRRWNDRISAGQTWNAFKSHFAMAYLQHKKVQGGTAAASGYDNAAVAQPADEDISGAAIDAFDNLVTATAVDRSIVATLTEANLNLKKQLEDSSQTLKEIRALLKKERNDRSSRKTFVPSNGNYCWTDGYKIARNHTSENCLYPKNGHKREANKDNNLRLSQANKE